MSSRRKVLLLSFFFLTQFRTKIANLVSSSKFSLILLSLTSLPHLTLQTQEHLAIAIPRLCWLSWCWYSQCELAKLRSKILDHLYLNSQKYKYALNSRHPLMFLNFLQPTGHVMHQRFNIQQLYALSTLYLCVLCLSENKQRLVPLTA